MGRAFLQVLAGLAHLPRDLLELGRGPRGARRGLVAGAELVGQAARALLDTAFPLPEVVRARTLIARHHVAAAWDHAPEIRGQLARQASGVVHLAIETIQRRRGEPAQGPLPVGQMLQVPELVHHAFGLALGLVPLLGGQQAAHLADVFTHGLGRGLRGAAELARRPAGQLALDLVELLLGLGQEVALLRIHAPAQLAVDLLGQGVALVGDAALIALEIGELA